MSTNNIRAFFKFGYEAKLTPRPFVPEPIRNFANVDLRLPWRGVDIHMAHGLQLRSVI